MEAIVVNHSVALNDASRPWKVIVCGFVLARYATKAQANRRAKELKKQA